MGVGARLALPQKFRPNESLPCLAELTSRSDDFGGYEIALALLAVWQSKIRAQGSKKNKKLDIDAV